MHIPLPLCPGNRKLLHLHGPRILVVEDDRELEPLVRRAAGALRPAARVDGCTSTERAH